MARRIAAAAVLLVVAQMASAYVVPEGESRISARSLARCAHFISVYARVPTATGPPFKQQFVALVR